MRAQLRNGRAGVLAFVMGIVAAFIPALPAPGQCDPPGVLVAVTTTGSFTKSCAFNAATGRWDLVVTLNGSVTTNPTVTITGGSGIMLGRVRVQNNTAIDCRVHIRGTSAIGRIGGLGSFDKGTSGNNKVLLLQLYTAGNVGYDREVPPGGPGSPAIRADMVYNLDIGGSVLGDIHSVTSGRSMGNVVIAGDLLGGVLVSSNASLDHLDVVGDIRKPDGEPVTMTIGGHIGRLTARSIAADITLSTGGVVHQFETTEGDFKGSLTATYLAVFGSASGPQHFVVARDLDASLSLALAIRVPITIGRDFKAARTVGGQSVPNIIWAARGFFDTPIVSPTGNLTVVRDFAGRMHLGTPLDPARGSYNHDISIGGAMLGIIECDHQTNANLSVLGPVLGHIAINRSVRGGNMISVGGTGLEGGASIRIGGGLLGTIALPPGGLLGHILINANLDNSPWSGQVSFGGTDFLAPPPFYANTADLTGGGGVGLAPFALHSADCDPPHNSSQGIAAGAFAVPGQQAVRIHSYGPVQPGIGQTWATALAIERLVSGTWVDASSLLTASLYPPGASASHIVGLAGVDSTPPPAGQYRVRPVGLSCFDVAFAPGVQWPSPDGYRFVVSDDCDNDGQADTTQIAGNSGLDADGNGVLDVCEQGGTMCPCEMDANNVLNVSDIFAFLSLWFAHHPVADFDGQNGIGVPDIFAFLACWFAHPPGC